MGEHAEPSSTRKPPAGSAPTRPAPPASAHDEHPLAPLHQALGNRGVLQRLAQPALQPRLEVGSPDDQLEREADATAAAVMRRRDGEDTQLSPSAAALQRAPDDERKKAPTKKAPAAAPPKGAAPAAKPAAKQPAAPKQAAPATAPRQPAQPKQPTPPSTAPKQAGATKAPSAAAKGPKAPAAPTQAPKPLAPKTPEKRTPPPSTTYEAPGERRREDERVQAKPAAPGAVPVVTPATARTIQAARGGGQGLPASDRGFYEQRLGRDLSAVRIHDDAAAHGAARDVQAKAFTYGQDVFFSAGRQQPGTHEGRELMAHELAHTIQQRPANELDRKVQRAKDARAPARPKHAPIDGAERDGRTKTITLPELEVPKFRAEGFNAASYAGPLTRPKGYSRKGLVPQRDIWIAGASPAVAGQIPALIKRVKTTDHEGRYFLRSRAKGMPDRYYYGTADQLAAELTTPEWDSAGRGHGFRGFEVDHVLELQLGGRHELANLQLLDEKVNASSGAFIEHSVDRAVQDYLDSLPDSERGDPKLGFDSWPDRWHVRFLKAVPPKGPKKPLEPTDKDRWSADQIKAGEHLEVKNVLAETDPKHFGNRRSVKVFPTETGGIVTTLDPDDGPAGVRFLKPFAATSATYHIGEDDKDSEELATFTFQIPKRRKALGQDDPGTVVVKRFSGMRFVGGIDRNDVRATLRKVRAKTFSPIELADADVGPQGVVASGWIDTDLPLIKGTPIDIAIEGDHTSVSHTFTSDDFKGLGPLRVTRSQLKVGIRDDAIGAEGSADLEIDRVGHGFIKADAAVSEGLALKGGFDFSSDMFKPAHVELGYRDGSLSGKGKVGLASGKVPGLKSGTLDVVYEDGTLTAAGKAQFDIPGVREADIHLEYSAEQGLTIGGTVQLGEVKGLRGGELGVTIAERPGGQGGYRLTAHGGAQPDIPGIDAQLSVEYDDGAFTAQGATKFSKGLVTGSVLAGATNRPVGEDGRIIADGAPEKDVKVFGSGVATMKLTSWLTGTAGITLLPDGEVHVAGELDVPGVHLWDPIEPAPTSLFHPPTLNFHIFGPVTIELGGELLLEYGVGAGILSGSLHIDYNPSHEDQTHVHGTLGLFTSAFAGLELDVFVGIGLDAWIGHVTGRILLGAQLRADAVVNPTIDIDWMPGKGIVLDPVLKASLTPRLAFHLDAVVSAGVGPFEKHWHKELGRREFGSAMAMGITVPSHYDDQHGFSVDWDRKQITKPDLDPLQTAKDFLLDLV